MQKFKGMKHVNDLYISFYYVISIPFKYSIDTAVYSA